MKILEKKLYTPKKEEREVVLLISDNTERKFNVAIAKAKPIINLTNAVYLFPCMVGKERARETYNKIHKIEN